MATTRFYNTVGGKRCESRSGRWLPSLNPYTGQVWASAPQCDRDDAAQAVDAAYEAFTRGPWAAVGASERGKLLRRVALCLGPRHAGISVNSR